MTGVQKGLILGIGGAAIGASIVGLSKHKFFIGGRKEKFDAFHKRVLEMAYPGIQQ